MENIALVNYSDKDDMIDCMMDIFDEADDYITLVADYETAMEFSKYYDNEDFGYFSMDLQNDVDLYYISKSDYDCFCINPVKHEGEYLSDDADRVFIMEEFLSDELLNCFEDYAEINVIELEEDCPCKNCDYSDCNALDSCEECKETYCMEKYEDKNCEEESVIDEEIEEFISNKVEDFMNEHGNEVTDEDIFDLVREIYVTAFEDGQKNLLIGLRDSINEGLED